MEEEYITIPKKEYDELKSTQARYAEKLKDEEYQQRWDDETRRIQSIIGAHVPNIWF